MQFVDLVCVNLYPFEATAARRGVTEHEVIENIDIGGPTMIRAAAKNFGFSAVVVKPESYDAVLQELSESDGRLSLATRESLAVEAFNYTARYDTAIARWFVEKHDDFPPMMLNAYEKVTDLAYGENPHQRAAYYRQVGARMDVLSMVRQLGGKELSFNNVLDLNAGRLLVGEFELPACAIIKHNNPCGCAVGGSALEAYQRAFACDPLSAFGGVICLNRAVDARARRGAVEPVRRGRDRAALHRRGGRDPEPPSRTCGSSRTASGAASTSPSATSSACSAACSCRTATWTSRTARRWRSSPSASRPSASGARCCSPGRSASTCARTRSCSRATSRRSASARGR